LLLWFSAFDLTNSYLNIKSSSEGKKENKVQMNLVNPIPPYPTLSSSRFLYLKKVLKQAPPKRKREALFKGKIGMLLATFTS
jgi:hypothetical protein